tara:strand:+ start:496 stop:1698 length:1203 start_codon:yes stop_codon:yes gene_type:complete
MTLKLWNADGKLKAATPCCMMMNFDHTGIPVNRLPSQRPDFIFDTKPWKRLRKDALQGIRNPACKVCWDMEDRGQDSYRMFSPPIPAEEIKNPSLKTIDLTLSNVCNLACRMCDLSNSNQLNKDYDKFVEQGTRDEIYVITGGFTHKYPRKKQHLSRQFVWLQKNTSQITTIKASGGEPFYDKHIMNVLDLYIKKGDAPNTRLEFHTNGTVIDDRVINKISKFKSNAHTFSVDGTGKTYEYIRHNADFKVLDNNIRNYLKLDNIEVLDFNFVISAHNIHNIVDYVKWIHSFDCDFRVAWSDVYPVKRGIHIGRLPKRILQPVYDEIQAQDWSYREHKDSVLQIIKLAMDQSFTKEGAIRLYRETEIFDMSRNQSYKDFLYHPMVEYLTSVKQKYLTKVKK